MKKVPFLDVLKAVALSPNVVSRKPIYEKYDKNVQGNTYTERGQTATSVILPFQDFPELTDDKKAIGVTVGTGGNPHLATIDPQKAAEMAICSAALQTSAVGGEWLGATDCLNFGNPEKSDQMGAFVAGVTGVKVACERLSIPIVSGNVSLYNESDGRSIPPSAMVSVFSKVADIKSIKPSVFTEPDLYIYTVGDTTTALGGSEFNAVMELGSTETPALDYASVKNHHEKLQALSQNKEVAALIPVLSGGVWGALLKGGLEANLGFALKCEADTALSQLLAEPLSTVVLSRSELPELKLLGHTVAEKKVTIAVGDDVHSLSLSEISELWHHQLRSVF